MTDRNIGSCACACPEGVVGAKMASRRPPRRPLFRPLPSIPTTDAIPLLLKTLCLKLLGFDCLVFACKTTYKKYLTTTLQKNKLNLRNLIII